MKKIKKVVAMVLVLATIIASQCVSAMADYLPDTSTSSSYTSSALDSTTRMLFHGTADIEASSITFRVSYTCSEDLSNSSGLYIRTIDSVTVHDLGNFAYVHEDVTILNVEYYNNHQLAIIEIEFYGREFSSNATYYKDTLTLPVV